MEPATHADSKGPIERLRGVYKEYPRQFWVLVLGAFIDRLGGALMFPFLTLYVTRKFEVGMTQVGVLFLIFSTSSVVGSMIGGALSDRLGRKGILIFGLVTSALASLLMGLVGRIELFFAVMLAVGLLANSGGPAQQAMVADLLPKNKRSEGYGILRVVANLAFTIGPMLGGFLAMQSYLLLFISDAVASSITAVIVFLAIRETRPARQAGESEPGMAQTFGGYLNVLRDSPFLWFMSASILMVLVYIQMNTTLPVYLRDVHSVPERAYGYILSLNAGMVVLFQFPITRRLNQYRPLVVMSVGTLLYAVGFAMYGLVSVYALFLLAMVIITIGEMLVSPVGQALVAQFAPEDMRGRYMAVYGFSWVVPAATGPLLAGLVMDNADARWLWYIAGVIGLAAAAAYYLLELQVGRSTWAAVDERLRIMEQLEEGHISAQEAATLLDSASSGKWGKLVQAGPGHERRHMHIRVSDLASGALKTNLSLPLGLVNTALHTGGRLSSDLDDIDDQELREMISESADQEDTHKLHIKDNRQVEISVSRYNRDRTF